MATKAPNNLTIVTTVPEFATRRGKQRRNEVESCNLLRGSSSLVPRSPLPRPDAFCREAQDVHRNNPYLIVQKMRRVHPRFLKDHDVRLGGFYGL